MIIFIHFYDATAKLFKSHIRCQFRDLHAFQKFNSRLAAKKINMYLN